MDTRCLRARRGRPPRGKEVYARRIPRASPYVRRKRRQHTGVLYAERRRHLLRIRQSPRGRGALILSYSSDIVNQLTLV